MLPLLASLLFAQAQPAEIDWNPRPAPEPAASTAPAKAESTFEEALAASYRDQKAVPKSRLGFGTTPPPPQTEQERIAAANAAAIARAEQAARDANAPQPWPDEGRIRCKPTETGIVCGNSEKAVNDPDSPSRQMLDSLLKPD